jgi:hypothetical protein
MALDLNKVKARLEALKNPHAKKEEKRAEDDLFTDEWDEVDENIYFAVHKEHSEKFVRRLWLLNQL